MNDIDIKKTTFVGYTEFGNMCGQSLKKNLQEESYPEESMIADYLRSAICYMTALGFDRDIFTGSVIGEKAIFTDGVYSWSGKLAHYVENYHQRLPKEFEQHILNQQKQKTAEGVTV